MSSDGKKREVLEIRYAAFESFFFLSPRWGFGPAILRRCVMGWDFSIHPGGKCPSCGCTVSQENIDDAEWDHMNYTYNVHPMYTATGVIGDASLTKLFHHMPTLEAAEIADKIVEEMEKDPEKYIALSPENGWGSYDGALKFMRKISRYCKRMPHSTVTM